MAYNAAKDNTASSSNENWKAQGFLNFYLPSKDGGKRKKLGAIPLKMNKPSEKSLLEWLNDDPSRAKQILAKLDLEYQSATPSESAGFALD
jgi:hypothetical protein